MLLLLLLAFLPLLWLSLVPGSACQHRTPVNSWIRQVKTTIAYSKNKIDGNSFNLYIYSHQLTCFTPLNDQNQKQEKLVLNFILSKWISDFKLYYANVLTESIYFLNGYTIVTRLSQRVRCLGSPLATMRENKLKENTVKRKELCSSAVSYLLTVVPNNLKSWWQRW